MNDGIQFFLLSHFCPEYPVLQTHDPSVQVPWSLQSLSTVHAYTATYIEYGVIFIVSSSNFLVILKSELFFGEKVELWSIFFYY